MSRLHIVHGSSTKAWLINKTEQNVPDLLVLALAQHRLHYTAVRQRPHRATHLFYLVSMWSAEIVGVFGDGDNAAYEWFRWDQGKLETSDCGYGSPHVALRDVLNLADPK